MSLLKNALTRDRGGRIGAKTGRREGGTPRTKAVERGLVRRPLATVAKTATPFPKRHGSPWRYSAFQRLVWKPMIRDAIKAWKREQTRPEPFSGLTCHDLRHTAASLMRQAGMPAELVAERLGHSDGGALLLRTYRHVRDGETRAALDAIGFGLRAAALTPEGEKARAGVC
jgi:integrase